MKRPSSHRSRRQATVVGVGLMGGSLGMALRKKGWRVVGLSRKPDTLRRARRLGAIDGGFVDPARALESSTVVVYCSPVGLIVPQARAHRRFISPGALVMDVGSVKGPIVGGMEKIFRDESGPFFVGAHPMAGSEKTGVGNARADLYRGAVCALTPAARTPDDQVDRADALWRSLGASTVIVEPRAHDRAVAMVSHLPHAVADALMLAAGQGSDEFGGRALLKLLAAGSFRDATRVAGADPRLWREIFQMNHASVRAAIRAFQKNLSLLAKGRWRLSELRKAHHLRREWAP